jgi:hypothetical protein
MRGRGERIDHAFSPGIYFLLLSSFLSSAKMLALQSLHCLGLSFISRQPRRTAVPIFMFLFANWAEDDKTKKDNIIHYFSESSPPPFRPSRRKNHVELISSFPGATFCLAARHTYYSLYLSLSPSSYNPLSHARTMTTLSSGSGAMHIQFGRKVRR